MFNAAVTDQSDIITEIFKAKGVLIGSCTVNNTVLRPTAGLLDVIKGLRFRESWGRFRQLWLERRVSKADRRFA